MVRVRGSRTGTLGICLNVKFMKYNSVRLPFKSRETHAKQRRTKIDPQAHTGAQVVFGRAEPRISLRLLEDVVQESVVSVVSHSASARCALHVRVHRQYRVSS